VALFQKYEEDEIKDNIVSIDLQTGKQEVFLSDPEKPLFHAFFSWDGRWVVFKRLETLQLRYPAAQILIAPVRHGVAGERSEWIGVTDGRYADDKPQFSPNGNVVYFTSTRDGYLCIWAQRLNPVTKRPVGQPFAYEHFHNASGRSAPMYQPWMSDLSVAREKMVINLPQVQSDMWVADMR
jgi:Tol biopolymer transport system component